MLLILGSSSPNRRALFDRLGVSYTVEKPEYEEIIVVHEPAKEQVERFAEGKARSILARLRRTNSPLLQSDFVLLGFDSMISCNGKTLGKAADKADMIEMILSFSGQTQQVITGVSMIGMYQEKPFSEVFSASTTVIFRDDITRNMLEKYAQFDDWSGKCGAYSILGTGSFLLDSIDGSFQNIVGVPVLKLRKVLEQMTGKDIFSLLQK